MDWASVLDTGVGVGVLLIGAGVFAAMFALARVFTRLRTTLGDVCSSFAMSVNSRPSRTRAVNAWS